MKYEYKCKECNKIYTKNFCIGKAPSKIKCVSCEKYAHKLISVPYIVFSGENWPDKERKKKR